MSILGWSYGGFMASWTITQADRFKAAGVGAGVTNLMSFTGTADIRVPLSQGRELYNALKRQGVPVEMII